MKKNNVRLLSQVRELIRNARQAAFRNVNSLQIITSFLIGKTIVEFEPEKQKQIFALEYKLYLPGKEELKKQIQHFINLK